MIVPNYVPEPLEVDGNVTQAPYAVRLAFMRRVVAWHSGSLAWIVLLSLLPWPRLGWAVPAGSLGLVLVGLDMVRLRWRGMPAESAWSVRLMPLVLLFAAWSVAELRSAGMPYWALGVGPVVVGLYTAAAGRDFSFMGAWVLGLIGSTVAVAGVASQLGLARDGAALAMGVNGVWTTYLVYDLASLMQRRRPGEAAAAVVDLYRDVFNFAGYVPRVIGHWRKHRIWVVPH